MLKEKHCSNSRVFSQQFPAIAIVGPRQVGKTTLVKQFLPHIPKPSIYLDLEKPSDLAKLEEAELFLSEYGDHCVVIDEVQRKIDLLPLLRSLIDNNREPLRFIILGSAGPNLLKRSSETLAGRIAYLELAGFNLLEISELCPMRIHHFRGGFPESTLAPTDEQSRNWLDNFIVTYIERDLPLLGLRASSTTIRKLWEMLAWQNGSLINYSSIGKSLGFSNHTIAGYIDFLENAYLVTRLHPYHFNIKIGSLYYKWRLLPCINHQKLRCAEIAGILY
ncbi:MAG: ATP-binding protein [Calditrichaeota bacterium]|nr:MAG: ATP-binding protein [Calditrichota bacterium]